MSLSSDRSCPYVFPDEISVSQESLVYSRVLLPALLGRPIYEHPFYSPALRSLLVVLFSITRMIRAIQGPLDLVPNTLELFHELTTTSPLAPSLFIYSAGDKLIPSEKVEEFIAHVRATRVVEVRTLRFGDDIPHTGSFYLKPDECKQAIRAFLASQSCTIPNM